jgi:hypothetical protein
MLRPVVGPPVLAGTVHPARRSTLLVYLDGLGCSTAGGGAFDGRVVVARAGSSSSRRSQNGRRVDAERFVPPPYVGRRLLVVPRRFLSAFQLPLFVMATSYVYTV